MVSQCLAVGGNKKPDRILFKRLSSAEFATTSNQTKLVILRVCQTWPSIAAGPAPSCRHRINTRHQARKCVWRPFWQLWEAGQEQCRTHGRWCPWMWHQSLQGHLDFCSLLLEHFAPRAVLLRRSFTLWVGSIAAHWRAKTIRMRQVVNLASGVPWTFILNTSLHYFSANGAASGPIWDRASSPVCICGYREPKAFERRTTSSFCVWVDYVQSRASVLEGGLHLHWRPIQIAGGGWGTAGTKGRRQSACLQEGRAICKLIALQAGITLET